MDQLRQRVPFKASTNEDDQDTQPILDEQQQEAVINDLKQQNESYAKGHLIAAQGLIGISSILQFLVIKRNPLISIYPVASESDASLPLPPLFVFLSLYIHGNLALYFLSGNLRRNAPTPLPFELLYSLGAVPSTLSLFLGKPWQTTAWWSITLFMVFVIQSIRNTIQEGRDGIAELEKLKYRAPGA